MDDQKRIRAALARACILMSGEEALSKLTLEAHLREMLDCINLIDNAAKIDPNDDHRDGVLFRFWIRAASYPGGWPSELMRVMNEEAKADDQANPAAYRRALLRLAKDKGVNLP